MGVTQWYEFLHLLKLIQRDFFLFSAIICLFKKLSKWRQIQDFNRCLQMKSVNSFLSSEREKNTVN